MAETMTEQERQDAFDLGVQVAMIQARGWKELNAELKQEKGDREKDVERCAQSILNLHKDMDAKVYEVLAKIDVLSTSLEAEKLARQGLEEVVKEQRIELSTTQQTLAEEKALRQTLEERLALEIDARVALEERVGDIHNRLNATEALTATLDTKSSRMDSLLNSKQSKEEVERRCEQMTRQVQAFCRDEDMKLEAKLDAHSRHMSAHDTAQDRFESELQQHRAEKNGLDLKIEDTINNAKAMVDGLRSETEDKMKEALGEELLRAGRYDEKLIKLEAQKNEIEKKVNNDREYSKELTSRLDSTNDELASTKALLEKAETTLDVLQHRVQRNVNLLSEGNKQSEIHERRVSALEEKAEEAEIRWETTQRRLGEEAGARERMLLKVNADSSTLALLKEEVKVVRMEMK